MRNCKSNIFLAAAVMLAAVLASCAGVVEPEMTAIPLRDTLKAKSSPARSKNEVPVIHVIVALCDNDSQGIVPVSKELGNGDDPKTNLYWGAAYGVETYFSKSKMWDVLPALNTPSREVLKRIAFKHKRTGAVLIADAYRGSEIKKSIKDFLESSAGNAIAELKIDGKTLQISGGANVIVYMGHNGLMDFSVEKPESATDKGERDAVVLACFSKKYFSSLLKETGTNPLLWTTNFMAPEAYILHDALEAQLRGESDESVRNRAASAYARYQKISVKASKGLLVTGW